MNDILETIFYDIEQELEKAKKKHPVFPLDAVGRCSIMSDESGEAVQVANDIVFEGLDDAEHREKLKTEVLQTACVCVRILEAMEHDK